MSLLKHRYSAVAIALHWILAFAILGMIGLGWYMGDLPNTATNKGDLYQLHKSIGILILILTIARIIWRMINKPPEEVPMEHTQAMVAKAVHVGFYALMILMPLTGWVLVSASTRGLPTHVFDMVQWPHLPLLPDLTTETKKALHPILETSHGKLAWVAIVLLVLHVVGALKHQFVDRDGLMARMIPGIFGATDGPREPTKGFVLAFGSAAAFFALVVGLGIVMGKADAKPTPPPKQAEASLIPNWAIDKDQSKIAFAGVYTKKPFEGRFTKWDAKINYSPEDQSNAKIEVVIDTTSAETGDNYSDKSLLGTEFFNVKNFPEARFSATGVFPTSDGLELTAVLTLKGKEFPVRMPFQLELSEGKAVMHSSFTLDRIALNLGLENDPNAEWISQTIEMTVHVVATQIG